MTLYLGATPIAGSMSAETLVDTLYPVGSCYIGTGATCPLAAIKGTWTLQSSAVVTSVNTNVPCKGNGMTLGLTDGTNKFGLTTGGGTALSGDSDSFNKAVATSGGTANLGTYKRLGITTDATKSGIVGTVTRSVLSVNIWKRTA